MSMMQNKYPLMAKAAAMGLFFLIVAAFVYLLAGSAGSTGTGDAASASGTWTCAMCPQFILPAPGTCPKCFMDLIPLDEGYGGGKLELGLKPEAAELAGIDSAIAEKDWDAGDDAPLRIPASAVLESAGRQFVYSESTDGEYRIFTLREIETGRRLGDEVEVLSGLDESEAVVSRGAFRVDSAMQILGKISIANLPAGDLADADAETLEVYQPAERSDEDVRAMGIDLDRWFSDYESIRAALAKDDFAATSGAVGAFVDDTRDGDGTAGEELGVLRRQVAGHVRLLTKADSLDGQRDGFDKLSADMTLLARRYGSPKGGLNLIYCPMAFGGEGAYWLQPQETVDNPYHGLEMPLCGWQVDAIPE